MPDDLAKTREVLRKAAAELIVTSGGVSVGDEDHIKPAVEAELAADVEDRHEAWPAAGLRQGRQFAFIGLPGNPYRLRDLLEFRPFC